MKKILIWTMAFAMALGFAACNKDNDTDNDTGDDRVTTDDGGAPANNLSPGEVHIRVRPVRDDNGQLRVAFEATTSGITIDWGDGTVQTLPGSTQGNYSHTYSHDASVNIKLQTTGLSYFSVEGNSSNDRGHYERIVFGTSELLTEFRSNSDHSHSYLDFSKCPNLAIIDGGIDEEYVYVDSLNLANNVALKELWVDGCNWLNVEGSTALEVLYVIATSLSSLDVSSSTSLRTLYIGGRIWNEEGHFGSFGRLTSLDVSKNTRLTSLVVADNPLTSLDVSNNTALTWLSVGYNQLTSLDVSKNTALTNLQVSGNQLTSLDVSNNTALTRLSVDGNQLNATALNSMMQGLPTLTGSFSSNSHLHISENPGAETCDISIARNKGWQVADCQTCTITIYNYLTGNSRPSQVWANGSYCGTALNNFLNIGLVVGLDAGSDSEYEYYEVDCQ